MGLNILLADDDHDDCLFFKDALDELALNASLVTVHEGEQRKGGRRRRVA